MATNEEPPTPKRQRLNVKQIKLPTGTIVQRIQLIYGPKDEASTDSSGGSADGTSTSTAFTGRTPTPFTFGTPLIPGDGRTNNNDLPHDEKKIPHDPPMKSDQPKTDDPPKTNCD